MFWVGIGGSSGLVFRISTQPSSVVLCASSRGWVAWDTPHGPWWPIARPVSRCASGMFPPAWGKPSVWQSLQLPTMTR